MCYWLPLDVLSEHCICFCRVNEFYVIAVQIALFLSWTFCNKLKSWFLTWETVIKDLVCHFTALLCVLIFLASYTTFLLLGQQFSFHSICILKFHLRNTLLVQVSSCRSSFFHSSSYFYCGCLWLNRSMAAQASPNFKK
jgi:hypothetical protein